MPIVFRQYMHTPRRDLFVLMSRCQSLSPWASMRLRAIRRASVLFILTTLPPGTGLCKYRIKDQGSMLVPSESVRVPQVHPLRVVQTLGAVHVLEILRLEMRTDLVPLRAVTNPSVVNLLVEKLLGLDHVKCTTPNRPGNLAPLDPVPCLHTGHGVRNLVQHDITTHKVIHGRHVRTRKFETLLLKAAQTQSLIIIVHLDLPLPQTVIVHHLP